MNRANHIPNLLASQWHGGSWQHLLALALWGGAAACCIILARRWHDTPRARQLRLGVGLFGIGAFAVSCAFYLTPERRDWAVSLPLQLCDLAAAVAPLAILTGRRGPRAVLHFWGFALCTQFFFTPVHEPGSPAFIVGWLLHGSILGLALFDTLGLGFRPAWPDLRTALLSGVVYAGTMFALNLATGFNYGYLGESKPGAATIVDSLGSWPARVLWIMAIAAAAMTAVYAVGKALRALTSRR